MLISCSTSNQLIGKIKNLNTEPQPTWFGGHARSAMVAVVAFSVPSRKGRFMITSAEGEHTYSTKKSTLRNWFYEVIWCSKEECTDNFFLQSCLVNGQNYFDTPSYLWHRIPVPVIHWAFKWLCPLIKRDCKKRCIRPIRARVQAFVLESCNIFSKNILNQ